MHLIIPRYLSVVAPGSALTWAWLTRRIDSRILRLVFCVGLVGLIAFEAYSSPLSLRHNINFKETHAFVNANIAADKGAVPVLVCSAFIESDYEPLPTDRMSENALNSQMYYYPIDVPVVMLPIDLNDESFRIGSQVVLDAAQRHERFLFVVPPSSYPTLQWLANYTRGAFTTRVLAEFDKETVVVEFRPTALAD